MAKPVLIDGKWHRWRRGKLVQIPDKWLGQVPAKQTIKKRQSKKIRKRRRDYRKKFFKQGGSGMQPDLGSRSVNNNKEIQEGLLDNDHKD